MNRSRVQHPFRRPRCNPRENQSGPVYFHCTGLLKFQEPNKIIGCPQRQAFRVEQLFFSCGWEFPLFAKILQVFPHHLSVRIFFLAQPSRWRQLLQRCGSVVLPCLRSCTLTVIVRATKVHPIWRCEHSKFSIDKVEGLCTGKKIANGSLHWNGQTQLWHGGRWVISEVEEPHNQCKKKH